MPDKMRKRVENDLYRTVSKTGRSVSISKFCDDVFIGLFGKDIF